MGVRLGVFGHAGDINDDDWFIADDPRIVTGRQQGNFTRSKFLCAAVIHEHVQPSGNVILQVRGFAAFGLGDGFDARGPFPSGLEGGAAEGDAAEFDEFDFAVGETADIVGFRKIFALHFGHKIPRFLFWVDQGEINQMTRTGKRFLSVGCAGKPG